MQVVVDWEKLEREVERPDGYDDLTRREKQIYLLRFSTDPPMSTALLAEKLGLSKPQVANTWARVREKCCLDTLEGVTAKENKLASGRVTQGEFLHRIEYAAKMVLEHLPLQIPKGDLRSLSTAFRDLMMMRNLILGEPTQIIGSNNRQTVNEVVEMLVREAKGEPDPPVEPPDICDGCGRPMP